MRRWFGEIEDPSARAFFETQSARWSTYGEVADRAASAAAELRFSRKALVFCFCQNRIESITAYLSCLDAGHAVLLLDPALNLDFKRALVELYHPDFILAPSGFGAALSGIEAGCYRTWEAAGIAFCRALKPYDHDLHPDLALLLSTSGSTGSPKLVRLSMRNVTANAQSIVEALDIRPEERAVSSLPFHYSYGLSVINSHLASGAAVVLTDAALTSAEFWETVRTRECTSFAGVPYTYQILARLKLDSLNAPTLKTMTQAGGKLHNELARGFHQAMCRRQGRFFVMYGQTEATARICVLPHCALPAKLGSAGKPIPGGSLMIEQDGRPVAEPLQSGELIYSGPNVMMGYASSSPDLALGDTQGGRLATGDLGYLDGDGFAFITGRMKRFSKLFGLRINLDEVELMLRPYGPTAVVGSDDRLLIFCEHGSSTEFQAYGLELGAKLNLHPRAFHFSRVERLPLTSNGKPDYPALTVLA
jgi:acyl-CoA synthetase (AMP-forming)/AMP-acid ligase II